MKLHEIKKDWLLPNLHGLDGKQQRESQIIAVFGEGEFQKYERWFKDTTAKNSDFTHFDSMEGVDGQYYDIIVEVDDYQPVDREVGINQAWLDYNIIYHGWSNREDTEHSIKEGEVELTENDCEDVREKLIDNYESEWDHPSI